MRMGPTQFMQSISLLEIELADFGSGCYSGQDSIMRQVRKWGFDAVPPGTPCGGMCGGDEAARHLEVQTTRAFIRTG